MNRLNWGKWVEVEKTEIRISGEKAEISRLAELHKPIERTTGMDYISWLRYNLEFNPDWELVKVKEWIQQMR